jgi:CBS-domain-containing membrane protein
MAKYHNDEHGKYTEKQDKTKDARMTKTLTPTEKKKFEAEDKKHATKKRPKTMEEDKKADAKIIRKIKSERKRK